jgi:hypothetical protein
MARSSSRGLHARAFTSEAADLAVYIDPQQPVDSIDTLLSRCLHGGADAPHVRSWPVARRLDGLISIRIAGGVAMETIALRCQECSEDFEIGLDLAASRPFETAERISFEVDGKRFEARCPTGEDHARWLAERPSQRAAAASLLQTETEPDESIVAALDAALASQDPARALPVSTQCPACEASIETVIALETQLLQAFATEQRSWLREVATVARSYSWSEAEIAAMPAWRRRFYLASAAETEGFR